MIEIARPEFVAGRLEWLRGVLAAAGTFDVARLGGGHGIIDRSAGTIDISKRRQELII
jgi:hypothetical protein